MFLVHKSSQIIRSNAITPASSTPSFLYNPFKPPGNLKHIGITPSNP